MFYVFGDTIVDRRIVLNSLTPNGEITGTLKANISFKHTTPGGAANVANNLRSLTFDNVMFYTATHGTREYGIVVDTLSRAGVSVFEVSRHALPVVKYRLDSQLLPTKIVRFDHDPYVGTNLSEEEYGCANDTLALLKSHGLENASAIVVANYHKGFFSRISEDSEDARRSLVSLARRYRIPLIVDPGQHLGDPNSSNDTWLPFGSEYTVLKFNRHQAEDYLFNTDFDYDTNKMSPSAIYAAVEHAMKQEGLQYKHLVITFGEAGYVTTAQGKIVHRQPPYMHPAVVDVCGAGDTFLAGLAVGLVDGRDIVQACEFAQIAAGVAVRSRGTVTVSRKDVLRCESSETVMTSLPSV